ncbi:stalk domain-containing protein [Paenibacillus macerans]|uniref:stalk domain-containing protein n=1 Tax=Paenibacillus macerans TaxID=44252 RepID=UPI003D320265
MRNKIIPLLLAACFWLGTTAAYAKAEAGSAGANGKSLEEAFSQLAIIPYDYQSKAYLQGQKADLGGDYEIVQRNGRVLVPIRLMGYLAEHTADKNQGYWDVVWNAKTPNDVLIQNVPLKKSVKFKVDSKTMLVNGKSVQLEVPPQKVGGRVMLPLRDAAVALGKNIDWLDGLILIGDGAIDLKHPRTLAVKDAVKSQLTDRRKRVDYEKTATPLTQYGNDAYYVITVYSDNGSSEQLYRKTAGKKESRIQVPGTPVFHSSKVIGEDLYYVSTVNGQSALYAYSLTKQQARKISPLGQWRPEDGWLADVRNIDGELYVNLHTGDNTMGGDTLYRVKNDALQKALSAKSVVGLAKDKEQLYYTDFQFMSGPANNLFRVDSSTGTETPLGEPGFAYGIVRSMDGQGGVGYTSDPTLYLKDGSLYATGFEDNNPNDNGAVYKISLTGRKHVKLIADATRFWLANQQIYYLDPQTGNLMRAGLDGSSPETAAQRKISRIVHFKGLFYYAAEDGGAASLYQYDPAKGRETNLGRLPAGKSGDLLFEAGATGIYYVSRGYEPGIYKIETDGSHRRLVKDDIEQAVLTDAGMIYTLVYEEGVYTAK